MLERERGREREGRHLERWFTNSS